MKSLKEGEEEKYTLKKENIHTNAYTHTPNKSKYLDMLQMSPCTLTWWELPMIQSVRYSTSLFRNFISCRNVSSSRRLIICTRKQSTTRVSSHSCRSHRSHVAWVWMEIITSIKQLSAARSFYSISPTTFSPHPTLLF